MLTGLFDQTLSTKTNPPLVVQTRLELSVHQQSKPGLKISIALSSVKRSVFDEQCRLKQVRGRWPKLKWGPLKKQI